MSTISGVFKLHQPSIQTACRQLLSLLPQHGARGNLQFLAQQKLFFSSSARLQHLSRRATAAVACSSVKTPSRIVHNSSPAVGKPTWQDQQQRRGIAADSKTTAVTVWEDLKQIRFSPVPALVLGFSGLIPFAAAPAYMVMTQAFSSQLLFAHTAYGACILSFLGGVRWGFVIPEESPARGNWVNFGYSVTPSLVAWTALVLPPPASGLVVMVGIAGSAYFDTKARGYPSWFKGLRFTLSFGAILSLWTAFLCQYMLGGAPADKRDEEASSEDDKKA